MELVALFLAFLGVAYLVFLSHLLRFNGALHANYTN